MVMKFTKCIKIAWEVIKLEFFYNHRVFLIQIKFQNLEKKDIVEYKINVLMKYLYPKMS